MRENAGLDQGQLAKLAGLSQSQVSMLEKGNRPFTQKTLDLILNAINKQYSDLFAVEIENNNKGLFFEDNFTLIPKYAAKFSGGPGEYAISEDIETNYAMRKDFLSRIGNIDKLAWFEVSGDSMAPEIVDGDEILVDRSKTDKLDVAEGKIYAIREGARLRVKRLRVVNDILQIYSDNDKAENNWDDSLHQLIGKVVIVGHVTR